MSEVVVGVDGSPAAARALRVAMQEASRLDAGLRVVHSWRIAPIVGSVPGIGYDVTGLALEDRGRWASDLLDAAIDDARRTGPDGLTIVKDVRAGDAATDLVHASESSDLLVLGSRRHGALASAVIGSATNYVLHHARCPVLVVPATSGPVQPWQRVVVGLDGSECAGKALRWAAAEARRHDCPLLVVHAWQLIANPDWFGSVTTAMDDDAKHIESWLAEHVAEVLPEQHDLRIELRAVEDFASAGLLGATGPDDLLVVGSHGRSGFADLVMGSVAMQCAHHARSAVAVLRTTRGQRS